MSARLKLKNAKKRIESMQHYCDDCLKQMQHYRALVFENMEEIGVDVEMTPLDTLRAACDCLQMNVEKVSNVIAQRWAERLTEYISDKLKNEYRINHFSRLSVRVIAPKPNINHVKVKVKELYG